MSPTVRVVTMITRALKVHLGKDLIVSVHLNPECKCNGHAKSCHFSRGLWLATGRRSGGVCDDCQDNTEGRHCQNCKKGFFRDPSRPKTAPDSCKRKALKLLYSLNHNSVWMNASREFQLRGAAFDILRTLMEI